MINGTKGIGKATLAYRFARFLLSQGAQTSQEAPSLSLFGDPEPLATTATTMQMAESAPMFRRIAVGSHTDLLTIAPAYDAKKQLEKSLITVDDARRVPEFLSLTPAEGEWRVVIVDAVDQLNPNAANALLKIMEEPPPRAILLLICHAPAAILPTIRSRCRSFKLNAPTADAFAEILTQIAPTIPQHDYAALYGLSYGSPGHAIALHRENALALYEAWLTAMQPNASPATRQSFADAAAQRKSPDSWAALIHGWTMAVQRISLYPHGTASASPIFRREPEMLQAIAEATPPSVRRQWVEQGNRLIHQTETFNLDKRYTIRALIDPVQLDMMAA